MKKLASAAAVAFALGSAALAQNAAAPAGAPPAPPALTPEAGSAAGLVDLEKTTFACPKAALNAAAREVAKYPSQGTYQFSYFNIARSGHHAAYEVRFMSNYADEPVLKFCVMLYCQQGFDPSTTTDVALIGEKGRSHASSVGHAADACSPPKATAKRR